MIRKDDDFCWGALAGRLLHPVQVEVVEALLWIDLPLSVTDLLQILDAQRSEPRMEHHLRRLRKLGAVAPEGSGSGQLAYRPVRRPKP